ncbi:MAG: DUF4892 domain-containing protein [Candidatus Dadabacteria bacterium]|nr:DUF4892 domain-containing protein [Candidatus Dadabacteria bacterium]
MKNYQIILLKAVFIFISLSFSNNSYCADVAGSKDHPVVSRYQGSVIKKYDYREFDEYNLLLGKVVHAVGEPDNKKITNSKKLEGKITRITYELAEDRSSLEVMKYYEIELGKGGAEILFSCSNKECGGRTFNHTVVPYDTTFGDNYYDQRYLAAKLKGSGSEFYISLYVIKNTSGGGPTKNFIYTQLDVIEVAAMQKGMVTIDADTMQKAILESGSVSIYGIYFDFDKANIKPESEKSLSEIAKLLTSNPPLNVFIVGHTDNKGSFDYNINLSQKRAEAVVTKLTDSYGIDGSRITPKGVGMLAPKTSNSTQDGRAKNRRVELVEK